MDRADPQVVKGIRDAIAHGYTWDEVADHIAGQMGADISAARKAGYSGQDIVTHLITPQDTTQSAPMPERPFIAGVGRGMEDVAAGAAGLIPFDSLRPEGFLEKSQQRADTYDEANKDIGFDGGRVLGQVAALTPLMLAGPGAAATTGARVAGNAALGATAGFLPRAKSIGDRVVNAAIGGLAGAALPEAVRTSIAGGIAAKNRIAAALNKGAADDVVRASISDATGHTPDQLTALLSEQAVDPDAMAAKQIHQYLTGLADDQLRATGKVDPAVLQRAAKISAVDPQLRPTLGQLTGDPAILSAEQNLSKSGTKAGNLISDRYRAQEGVLREAGERMADDTGGQKLSPYQFGGKAGEFMRGKWAEMQDEIGKAYKAVEQAHGDVPVDVGGLVRQVADTANTETTNTANGKMATIALNRLKTYGLLDSSGNLKQGANLTINQLRDLRQALSSAGDLAGMSKAQSIAAKSRIIGAIDDSVEGSAVGDVFKPARAMARARFNEFADRTLGKIQRDSVPDEALFDLVTGRNVDTAKDYVSALTTGTPEQMTRGGQILADTRRKLIADILSKAQSGAAGDETFRPAALRTALDPAKGGYDPEVLDAVLGQHAGKLRDFQWVVDLLRADPSFNSINYSKSGALLSGLTDGGAGMASRLPGGSLTGDAVRAVAGAAKDKHQQKIVEALLSGSPRAVPGHLDAQVVDALTANPTLIDLLMNGPRTAAATALPANRR